MFVLGGLRIGGYEILSVRLANSLAECHDRIGILSLSEDNQILNEVSRRVVAYTATRKHKYDATIIRRTIRVLKDFKPDLILSCAYFEHFTVRCAAAFYRYKARFVLSFHTTQSFDSTDDHWKKLYGVLATRFNDVYVAIHSSQVEYYSRRYRLPVRRFTLIQNGVDTEYFAPVGTKSPQGDDNFRIVHVANLKPLKDQWTLLRAVEELNKSHKKWRLCVVGADQCGLLREYKYYISQKGFSDKVQFIGAVSDIRNILSDADAFVLTSLTEALPMSIIEAIAMGLPCIVTNVGGNSDIIEHGKEGYLVAPGDYMAIAGFMRTMIADPAQMRKMGIAARLKAVKQFDFNMMVERYNELFSNILSA